MGFYLVTAVNQTPLAHQEEFWQLFVCLFQGLAFAIVWQTSLYCSIPQSHESPLQNPLLRGRLRGPGFDPFYRIIETGLMYLCSLNPIPSSGMMSLVWGWTHNFREGHVRPSTYLIWFPRYWESFCSGFQLWLSTCFLQQNMSNILLNMGGYCLQCNCISIKVNWDLI